MPQKKYSRLTLSERVKIETLLKEDRSRSYIAGLLGRSRSTISNELNKWKGSSFYYNAEIAYEHAKLLNNIKRNKDKISLNSSLRVQLYRGLLEKLSPELISGRLKLMYPNDPSMQISYESIYRYIYAHPQGKVNKKLIRLLLRKKTRRRTNKKRAAPRGKIKDAISIEQRPFAVENRNEVGHWEGDLVIGAKHNSCIGSIVERKSRYTLLVKLNDKKSKTVCSAFSNKLNKLPTWFRKTMTYDNGTEMAEHKWLSQQTGMEVYFAHAYSSWERGTNENTNGLVRRYYPKKTDFNNVSEKDLEKLQDHLNNRPRKVLGFYTANEIYQWELSKAHNNNGVGLDMGNKSTKDLFSFLMPNMV